MVLLQLFIYIIYNIYYIIECQISLASKHNCLRHILGFILYQSKKKWQIVIMECKKHSDCLRI